MTRFSEQFDGECLEVLVSILAHTRDCIKLLNRRGELQYLSASANNALSLAEGESAVGRVWREMWPESERPALDRAVAAAWEGESARFDGTTLGSDGNMRHWEVVVSPVRGTSDLVTHVLAVSTEVTAQREIAAQEQLLREMAESRASMAGLVSHELRHRLKNQLAVVNAVAKLLSRHTADARELSQKLETKLIAMGQAQDLLAIERSGPMTAAEAVSEVLAASGAGDRVAISHMPQLALPEESLQQIALLLSELQTNALKYGALRDGDGTVTLAGSHAPGVLSLHWTEQCGRPVTPVDGGNGGFQLIRRLGASGGQQPVIEWHPDGIAVTVHVRAAE